MKQIIQNIFAISSLLRPFESLPSGHFNPVPVLSHEIPVNKFILQTWHDARWLRAISENDRLWLMEENTVLDRTTS